MKKIKTPSTAAAPRGPSTGRGGPPFPPSPPSSLSGRVVCVRRGGPADVSEAFCLASRARALEVRDAKWNSTAYADRVRLEP